MFGRTKKVVSNQSFQAYTPIDSKEVCKISGNFAEFIKKNLEPLKDILLTYESYEVVEDEISRTLDLLENLSENKDYFKLRIGEVTTFLPRNQPLYAFTCFVVIPSLMASEVHFRIPHAMRSFFSKMLEMLHIDVFFPNIYVSKKQRLDFLTERSALRFDPVTRASRPVTDAVIFTGTSEHAAKLRNVFDQRTLFISNGSGHNPIVIGPDANIENAIEAVTTLQFYNQGQDCAAPNAILIHTSIYDSFLEKLHEEIKKMKIGEYTDKTCRLGPISDVGDLVRVQEFLCDNERWISSETPGFIETKRSIVYPTVISKALSEGGNYSEIFAPIIFAQRYENDAEIAAYIETKEYQENAMYITLYGTNSYILNLIDREVDGIVIHPQDTFLHNKHLHEPGVERGVKPYGGYGVGASSASIGGKVMPMPTLPQRDIYEFVAKPMIEGVAAGENIVLERYSDIYEKNVQKILRISSEQKQISKEWIDGPLYVDTHLLQHSNPSRYVEIHESVSYRMLSSKNVEIATQLRIDDKNNIAELINLIQGREKLSPEEFKTALYAIPKSVTVSDLENKRLQKNFFELIYQLLFGKDSGPKLTTFLYEASKDSVLELLDII